MISKLFSNWCNFTDFIIKFDWITLNAITDNEKATAYNLWLICSPNMTKIPAT